jgi:HK97 family phage major capsid protein
VLDAELREGLLDALESEVISGAGTGEHMTGILHASSTTAVSYSTDVVTTLRSALTACQTNGITPTGWILNPSDAQTVDLTKEGSGGVGFMIDGYQNTNSGSGNIFGHTMPRVVSPSIPAGTALLGDFTKGRIYVRQNVTIDLDPFTNFAKNETVIRAEFRVGFAVLRPESFCVIDLTAGT